MNIRTSLRLVFLVSLAWQGACTTVLTQPGGDVPVVEGNGQGTSTQPSAPGVARSQQPQALPRPLPAPPPATAAVIQESLPASSPAVTALLGTAEKERQAGRTDRAAAVVERALDLEPQNALLWSRLALIRLEQRNWQQAVVLAGRSNSFARNNRSLQIQNWQIIESAKTGMGDNTGAAAARQMLQRLGGGR
jgi:tetratricopeptide (TPR) repeat protein